MIKIGDFARLAQVSVPTLRHYDDIGLLKPNTVDNFTGYRYYSVSQLPRLNRILALKDLGFSLEQIDQVLGGLTVDQLRGMMKLKQAEVEQRLIEEEGRLTRIKTRLKQIELEDSMSDYDVVLKTVPAILIASQQVTIPTNKEVPAYIGPAFDETYAYVKQQGAKEAGPSFAVWHQAPEVHVNEVAETAIPIDRAVPGTERIKVYELPSTQVASLVHHGDFKNLIPEHTALYKWVEENGYRVVGPYREIYMHNDPKDMSNSATEIQYPVEKV